MKCLLLLVPFLLATTWGFTDDRPLVVEVPGLLRDPDFGRVGVLLGALDDPAGHVVQVSFA